MAYTDERVMQNPNTMEASRVLDQCNACEYVDLDRGNLQVILSMAKRMHEKRSAPAALHDAHSTSHGPATVFS